MKSKLRAYVLLALFVTVGVHSIVKELRVVSAEDPRASSPEDHIALGEPVDCVLGEVAPAPVVPCGQVVEVRRPIAIPASNGGTECPIEMVQFTGPECVCPDGSKVDPNRTDCEDPFQRVEAGCCITDCP